MDIRNFLDYPAEQVVTFIPNINDLIKNQRAKLSSTAIEEADDRDDTANSITISSPPMHRKYSRHLKRSGCNKMKTFRNSFAL